MCQCKQENTHRKCIITHCCQSYRCETRLETVVVKNLIGTQFCQELRQLFRYICCEPNTFWWNYTALTLQLLWMLRRSIPEANRLNKALFKDMSPGPFFCLQTWQLKDGELSTFWSAPSRRSSVKLKKNNTAQTQKEKHIKMKNATEDKPKSTGVIMPSKNVKKQNFPVEFWICLTILVPNKYLQIYTPPHHG